MLKPVLFLSAISCALGAVVPEGLLPQLDGRIVGGEATSIGSYPWQVSLQHRSSHSCGGSIYNHQIVVTAAHCLQSVSASALEVRAGSSFWNTGGVLVNVTSFKVHDDYNPRTMVNDIAIIKLASSLALGANIKSIPLASSAPASGAAAVVSGWGTTQSGSYSIPSQIRFADVKIVSRYICASSAFGYGSDIKSTMICSYNVGRDSCQGDSGGPLVSGGVLVGVVSWGYGCAYPNYPGVYADVAALRGWVIKNVNSI